MNNFIAPPQDYWDSSYEARNYSFANESDPLSIWLKEHIPHGTGECLEVGICPGRYTKAIASKGYTINGIDNSESISELSKFLNKSSIPVNEMICSDFLSYEFDRKFDVVASLGFIEHFKSWRQVIRKMSALVKTGGYFVCEVPNFRSPIQFALREELDKKNLNRHNLESMNLDIWKNILISENFSISHLGAFGGFDFWVDHELRDSKQLELLEHVLSVTSFLKNKLTISDISYSPYLGIVAQKY